MAYGELIVRSCDLLKSENTAAHHTDDYDTDDRRLVVRRGQVIHLRLTFNRNIEFQSDEIRFELETGGTARKSEIKLRDLDSSGGDGKRAGVRYSKNNTGNPMDLEVFTASDMGAGQWSFVMYSKYGHRDVRSMVAENIVVLFNAWNKDDDVYMENSDWRDEYVMNDHGRQYCGSAHRIGGMDWYFGQFESEVMDVVLKLMNMERLPYRDRGDAVAVARHLSALVNSNDDNGVLVGNWSGDYDDGAKPSDWIGSYAILKQYLETGAPVRYGQCWVFAGVLCTVLRALGIPARCVTNFESAHDTDANLTIDCHYDKRGRRLDDDDSIWNFHVWNDVWMARHDLPSGFGGWQALDATPQERSSGRMRCGPMSINAIKQGLIHHDYDGPFIYAEVNGTRRHWKRIQKNPEKWEELLSETAAVGKNISTKQVGTDLREDITIQYKYPEGSRQELLSFKEARKHVKFTKVEKKATKDVVKFVGAVPDDVLIGQDVVVTFRISNISKVTQEVYISVVVKVMQYNGSVVAKIHSGDASFKVAPRACKEVKATVKPSLYLPHVKSNESIKLFFLGEVKNPSGLTLQTFAFHGTVDLEKPVIDMELSKCQIKVGDRVQLALSFINPFSQELPPGKLRVEGSGITGVLELNVPSIDAKAKFSKTVEIVPKKPGPRMIVAGYSSAILSGLQGGIRLNVSR